MGKLPCTRNYPHFHLDPDVVVALRRKAWKYEKKLNYFAIPATTITELGFSGNGARTVNENKIAAKITIYTAYSGAYRFIGSYL